MMFFYIMFGKRGGGGGGGGKRGGSDPKYANPASSSSSSSASAGSNIDRGGGGDHINASNAGASAAGASAASSSSNLLISGPAFTHDELLSLSLIFCRELSKKTNAHACFTLYHSDEHQYLCKSYKLNKAMHDGRKDFCSSRGDSIFFKEYETFMKNQGVTVNKYEKAVVSMSDSIEKILKDSSSSITCALAFIADDPYAKVTESSLTQMGVTFDKTKSCVLPDHGMSHRTLKYVCSEDVEIEQNWSICYDGGKTMPLEYCPREVAGMCFVLRTQVCIILTTPVKNNGIVHVDGVACVFDKRTNSFMKNIKFTTNKSLITENVKHLLPGVDWLVQNGMSTFGESIALCFLAKLWADTSLHVTTEFYNKNNKDSIDAGTKKEIVVATHDVGSAENSTNINPYVSLVNDTEHHLLPACMLIAHTTSVNAVVGQKSSKFNRSGTLFCRIMLKLNITSEERTENLRKWQINQEYFKKIEYSEERLTLLKNLKYSLFDIISDLQNRRTRSKETYRDKIINIGNIFSKVKNTDRRNIKLIAATLIRNIKKQIIILQRKIKLLSKFLPKDKEDVGEGEEEDVGEGEEEEGGGTEWRIVDSSDSEYEYSDEPGNFGQRTFVDENSESHSPEELKEIIKKIEETYPEIMKDFNKNNYTSSKFKRLPGGGGGGDSNYDGDGEGDAGGGPGASNVLKSKAKQKAFKTGPKKGGNPPRKTRKQQKHRKYRKTYRK